MTKKKWKVKLNLNEYESELVHEALKEAAVLPSKSVRKDTLNDLKNQIEQVWTERREDFVGKEA